MKMIKLIHPLTGRKLSQAVSFEMFQCCLELDTFSCVPGSVVDTVLYLFCYT